MRKLVIIAVLIFVGACDSKPEDERSDESLLRFKQIAEQFDAKIASEDIEELIYTADFQDYFSDPKQHFVFDLQAEDLLKQNGTIMGKFISGSDAVLFLKINQEMLQTIKAEEAWETFIIVATIDRVYKPFFGLTGNVDEFEVEYIDVGYEEYSESYPVVEGNFYVEVVDAPVVLHGECLFIEYQK